MSRSHVTRPLLAVTSSLALALSAAGSDAAPSKPKATHTASAPVSDAVRVTEVRPADIVGPIGALCPTVRLSVAAGSILLEGPAIDVARAKALIARIDVPGAWAEYSSVYRLRYADAKSVGRIVARSFPNVRATADSDLNIVSVFATGIEQMRVAHAIAQIDVPESAGPDAGATGASFQIEVVNLKAAMPSSSAGTPSTTTADVAMTVLATLATVTPDLKITPVPNLPQLIVSGTPYAVRLAKQVIARIDTPQKLVVLDTQILEVNETVAKNLGLSFAPNAGLTTTYSETTPQPNAAGNAIPLLGLQPLSRTPLSLQFQLGLAISQGKGRILADPRITTLNGKTATIRAGDNLTVLTQSGGGTGVAVTTQLQTFNTGVSLDITPIVNDDGYVTINLHPVVNNVSSISSAGIPQISTRDTQTTIGIKEDQTLVIGGLIQDSATRTTNKIPILGDLPLIGPVFRNEQVNNSRDELIITITPHVIDPLQAGSLIPLPPPAPLPNGSSPATTVNSAQPSDEPSLGPIRIYGPLAPNGSILPGQVPAQTAPSPSAAPTLAPSRTVPNGVPPNPLGPLPFPLPGAPQVTPQASPSAFAATNVFTYGSPPSSNYAAASDPPQIFFAMLGPTVLHDGVNVTVSAITTSNVSKVTIGYGNSSTSLAPAGLGKWQVTYPFSAAGVPSDQQSVQLTLTALRADGTSTNISIPVNVASS